MRPVNVVGKSFGMILVISLLVRLCRTGCSLGYLGSQRRVADDGADSGFGSRRWHRVVNTGNPLLGYELLNGGENAAFLVVIK